DANDVLDLLSELVSKSLVMTEEVFDEEFHYRLLETIRQYSGEKLEHSRHREQTLERHFNFYAAWTERAVSELRAAEQARGLEGLERQLDNLHAAMEWAADKEPGKLLMLAAPLGRFWLMKGYFTEGRKYLADALAGDETTASYPLRARAL